MKIDSSVSGPRPIPSSVLPSQAPLALNTRDVLDAAQGPVIPSGFLQPDPPAVCNAGDSTCGQTDDPKVLANLKAIGYGPGDFSALGNSLTHVVNAANDLAAGNWGGALNESANLPPAVSAKIATYVYNHELKPVQGTLSKLGISAAQFCRGGPATPHLAQAANAVLKNNWGAALAEAASAGDPAFGQKVAGAIYDHGIDGKLRASLSAIGVDRNAFVNGWQSAPAIAHAANQLLSNDWNGALQTAAALPQSAQAIAQQVWKQNPKLGQTMSGLGISEAQFSSAGGQAQHLANAANGVLCGDWATAASEAAQAPAFTSALAGGIWNMKGFGDVKSKLESLGVTESDFASAGSELGHIATGINQLATGDLSGFAQNMASSQAGAGSLVKEIEDKAYGSLSADAQKATAALHITGADLRSASPKAQQLLVNAGKAFADGSIGQALTDIGQCGQLPPALAAKISSAVLGPAEKTFPQLKGTLNKLGIDAGNLQQIVGAIPSVVALGDDLTANPKNWSQTVKDFGTLVQALPDGLKSSIAKTVAQKLGISGDVCNLVLAAGEALTDPNVLKSLGDAVNAIHAGNPADTVHDLTDAAQAIVKDSPDAAVTFLNAMGNLPGSIGQLFKDPGLNQAVVQSGALDHLLDAADLLVPNKAGQTIDFGGALNQLAQSLGSLVGEGDHFNVAGHELPIGMQGLQNIGALINRFWSALPPQVQSTLESKVAQIAGDTGLHSLPLIGNAADAWTALSSGKSLIGDLQQPNKDWLQVAIDGANTGLDVIGALDVAGGNDLIEPLQTAVGVLQVVQSFKSAVNDVSSVLNVGAMA